MVSAVRAISLALVAHVLALACFPATAQTILVDVGHSLSAPGSRSASGVDEFRYNQALAADVAAELAARGYRVVMPNADDHVTSLAARPASASAAHAALFLAIHHDSIQPGLQPWRDRYSGFSVWTSGSHPRAAGSAACATSVGRSMVAAGMTPALFHAAAIHGEGRDLVDRTIGRYRRDDLAVLRLSKTPAILVEAGVIANPVEEAWLARPEVRTGIARAIADGVSRCVRR
jgi:N-acetylmuramoyl-L-alanine amidase